METTGDEVTAQLVDQLGAVPMLDAHTHLVDGRLGARGLHDILLYHMVISDLHAAGAGGARLTPYPDWPDLDEAHGRIRQALPYLQHIQNTSCYWGVRIILRDLYDWDSPITAGNWEKLDAIVRERADDRSWQRQIMRKANIHRFSTELARRTDGQDDDLLHYSLEWAFFTACVPGEFDTALCELERCWGATPDNSPPRERGVPATPKRAIESLDDVHSAVTYYADAIPYDRVISTATHISTDLDLQPVSDADMAAALRSRDGAGPRQRSVYAAYVNEALLTALERHGDDIVFQFSLGAEPLPFETGTRISQRTLAQLAEMIGRHPGLRFQCLLASRHANQSLCTFCRELPNLSLAGYWWHNFFPGAMRQVMEERLDMLPTNKQVGFFSDAYCIEWAYAKSVLVRRQLAQVLAQKVKQGQYSCDGALDIARAIFYDCPQRLLGMQPAG